MIVSEINESAYLTHHSAFEYYGFTNQVYYEIYMSEGKKFTPFEFDDITYRYIYSNLNFRIEKNSDGVKFTDLERTILDDIKSFEKVGGLEELLKCIELTPNFNEEKNLIYLEKYNKNFLYQKVDIFLNILKSNLIFLRIFLNVARNILEKVSGICQMK